MEQVPKEPTLFECFNQIKPYQCKRCPNFRTNFLERLKSHIRGNHQEKNSEEEVYKCLQCAFMTFSQYLYFRHSLFSECATVDEEEKKKRFVSYRVDATTFTLTEKLIDSLKKNRNDIGPCNCKAKSSANSRLESDRPKSGWWYCGRCPYKCQDQSELMRHIMCGHSKPVYIYMSKSGPSTESRMKSSGSSSRGSSLQKSGWWYCGQCLSKYIHKYTLMQHIKDRHSKHENSRLFKCYHCSYESNRKDYLKTHMIYRHSEPEAIHWFPCAHCSSKFKEKRNLLRHMKSCHAKPEEMQWFACGQCPSKFRQNHSLKAHITKCHSKPEDIHCFECDQCPLKFKLNQYLTKHKKNCHSKPGDIQWFKCNECFAKFKRRGNLNSHIKNRHSKLEDIK